MMPTLKIEPGIVEISFTGVENVIEKTTINNVLFGYLFSKVIRD
jgi:hypothetical protein